MEILALGIVGLVLFGIFLLVVFIGAIFGRSFMD